MVINMKRTIPAGQFKQHCLSIMDEVAQRKEEIIITKRGKPVAKICPLESYIDPVGFLKGSMVIKGDIVAPTEEEWNTDSYNE